MIPLRDIVEPLNILLSFIKKTQVLKDSGRQDPAGGIILLLSDGKENKDPYIAGVTQTLIDADVIVNTIAFTQEAEVAMYDLAIATGKNIKGLNILNWSDIET